ncbi:uncharacterized protein LOC115625474 [Scaptodrosophila lebanonensis]|uniref:Uncharacterized protein LOC115625474 n=1 Tax=Drosophila lebanonensis TaxID=7225 RepID=A0A6J2TK49_DROLE|nr:uncharacterized protein LOC115625474 [Scaptodrosophila lebanonensis]
MKLVQVLLICTALKPNYGQSSWNGEISRKATLADIKILRVNMYGEPYYMRVGHEVNPNRSHFDIHVQLNRELGSNYLIMNIKLRSKPEDSKSFVTLFELKRLDFCGFLTEYKDNSMLRSMIRKSMQLSHIIVCPLRTGNFSIRNISVTENLYPENLQKGLYKFFVEIVEATGEIAKIFAMQVTTALYCC